MKFIIFVAAGATILFAAERNDFQIRKARVQNLLQQQDYSTALAEANRIRKEWPDDVTTYQLIAAAALGSGDYAEAESAMQWMLDLRIGHADSEGWLLVSRFREVTGDIEGALESIRAAFGDLRQDQPEMRDRLVAYSAHLYLLQGRKDLADRTLQAVSERIPGHAVLLKAHGELRVAQGRREEATTIFRQLVQAIPSAAHRYLLATTTGNSDDYGAFTRAARECISGTDNANVELVIYLAGPGASPVEALEIARREYARRRDVRTCAALSLALFRTGREGEARELMKRTLSIGTRDPEILRISTQTGVSPE